MRDHGEYWMQRVATGQVVTFGFVADPKGGYGIGVVEFDSEGDVQAFTSRDPTIQAEQGFQFEILPMPMGAARA